MGNAIFSEGVSMGGDVVYLPLVVVDPGMGEGDLGVTGVTA